MRRLRLGFVPIVRPLFRGANMGLWEASQRALAELAEAWDVELAFTAPPVGEPDEAEARAQEALNADLDLVLVQYVTFATGDLITPFLKRPLRLGLWALPEAYEEGPLPQNALCGLNMALSLDVARRTPAKWFYGPADSDPFQTELARTIRALRGARALTHGRVLWVGGTAPGFYRLQAQPDIPLTVDRAPLDAVSDALAEVPDAEVEERLADLDDDPGDYTRQDLRNSMRLEAALERLGENYDGVALRCWPEVPDKADAMTCSGYARLGDRGHTFACEGDLAGLASMLAIRAITDEPAALLDLTHVDAESEACLFWHCGNVPKVWARPTDESEGPMLRLVPHFNRGSPAVRDMTLRPGPVSGLRLLENRRAVVYAGEVQDRPGGFEGVSGWITAFRWDGQPQSPASFMASAFGHRLPHHFVWGLGDHEDALRECCAWLDHEVLPPPAHPEGRMIRWPE